MMENPTATIAVLKEKIHSICLELSRYGEETVVISVNVHSKTSSYYGSSVGCKFLNNTKDRKEIIHQLLAFSLEHVYEDTNSHQLNPIYEPREIESGCKKIAINNPVDYSDPDEDYQLEGVDDSITNKDKTVQNISNVNNKSPDSVPTPLSVESFERNTVISQTKFSRNPEMNSLPSEKSSSAFQKSSSPLQQSCSPLQQNYSPLQQSCSPLQQVSTPLQSVIRTGLLSEHSHSNDIAEPETVIIMTENLSQMKHFPSSTLLFLDNLNFYSSDSYKSPQCKTELTSTETNNLCKKINSHQENRNSNQNFKKSQNSDFPGHMQTAQELSSVYQTNKQNSYKNVCFEKNESFVHSVQQPDVDTSVVVDNQELQMDKNVDGQSFTEEIVKNTKGRSFKKEIELVDVFGKQPYMCSLCGVRFTRVKNLYNHKKRLHSPDVVKFKCKQCNTSFRSQKSLDKHFLLHSIVEGLDYKIQCNTNGIIREKSDLEDKTQSSQNGNTGANCVTKSLPKQIQSQIKESETKTNYTQCINDEENLSDRNEGCYSEKSVRNTTMNNLDIVSDKMSEGNGNTTDDAEVAVCANMGMLTRNRSSKAVLSKSNSGTLHNKNKKAQKKNNVLKSKDNQLKNKDFESECQICGNKFSRLKNLKEHLRKVHSIHFKCSECSLTFCSDQLLKEHEKSDCGNKGLKCTLCGKIFAKRYNMQRHVTTVHDSDKKFKCETCGKEFKSMEGLKRHCNTHTDVYRCNICGLEFLLYLEMVSHRASAHKKEKKLLHCVRCGKQYRTKQRLTVHMRNHTGERPFECPICKKRFKAKETLQYHKSTHFRSKTHLCDMCGKEFLHKTSLIVHKRCHSGEKYTKCKYCGKLLASKQGLRSHMVTFHFDKDDLGTMKDNYHQCDVCGKIFLDKQRYLMHKMIHTGEKPYRCHVCGRRFNHPQNRNAHMDTHNKIRSHSCIGCSKTFMYKKDLLRHAKNYCPVRKGSSTDCSVQTSVSNSILLQY